MTGKELAETVLRLIEKCDKDCECCLFETVEKIEQICQDVVDEW